MTIPKWATTVKTLLIAVFVTLPILGFFLGRSYEQKLSEKNQCKESYTQYVVVVEHDRFLPAAIDATRCGKLTFINRDTDLHEIAFGEHNKHIPYGDFLEESLLPNERISIILAQTGKFKFHDHLHDEIQGILNVKPSTTNIN